METIGKDRKKRCLVEKEKLERRKRWKRRRNQRKRDRGEGRLRKRDSLKVGSQENIMERKKKQATKKRHCEKDKG